MDKAGLFFNILFDKAVADSSYIVFFHYFCTARTLQ